MKTFVLQSENSAPIRLEQLPMFAQRHLAEAKLSETQKKPTKSFQVMRVMP